MPDFIVSFTRTIECSISIKAKDEDTARDKFDNGIYRESDIEAHNSTDEIDE